MADGIGAWANVYGENGTLLSETLPQTSGWTLEYGRDFMGRVTNLSLKSEMSNLMSAAFYTFDTAGRLHTVSDGTRTAAYGYGSDGATVTNISFGGPLNVAKTYDGLNRLTQASNMPSNGSPISFTYQYNQANQRTKSTAADGSYWQYQYDNLGQVVSGKKYFSDGVPAGGAQFEYDFDTIGNRESARNFRGAGTEVQTYTANELNQYTERTVPGEVFVTGTSAANATVSVRLDANSTAKLANRHGAYYWQALDADNTATLVATTNLQVRTFMTVVQGTNTNSFVRTETRREILPQTPEAFTYDADGNLTSDGLWTYSWDAENRLIAVESRSGVSAAFMKRLTFQYDYMSRRISKKVYEWQTDHWSLVTDNWFIYDGWNLISETSTGVSPVGLHAIEGLIKINPNNSPNNEFSLALPDGSTITRDGLQQDFAGYSGPATSIHVKPVAGGSQNGLTVDGEPFSLDNSETYDITSHPMTVNLYNDRMKKGKAVGRWWISIQATNATITSGNVAPITNQQSAITNYYVWGLDLSGSLQGAGGIGGLLCVSKSGTGVSPVSYFPTFDANGNVSELINPQSEITNPQSLISAHYEYSPFGEPIVSTGVKADTFPFRFSTKYLDTETGLYNYGYRYYSPALGRWLSRDPLTESGFHLRSKRVDELELIADLNVYAEYYKGLARVVLRDTKDFRFASALLRFAERFSTMASVKRAALLSKGLHSFVANNPVAQFDPLGLVTCQGMKGAPNSLKCDNKSVDDDCTPAGCPPYSMTCQAYSATPGSPPSTISSPCVCKKAK